MSVQPPSPGEPRRPHGPRDPGDAWVIAPTGERYWGRFGAAGLLAFDPVRGVLLQHRVSWSHFGGTWGLPGGARHEGESAADGAMREAAEEAGVPHSAIVPRMTSVLDVDVWTYTTLLADVVDPFEPVISDPESLELAWIPVDRVADYPLHPGFADAWPMLRAQLETRPAIVVDAANVVGSVPDGWWKDRAGAAARLVERIGSLSSRGVAAAELGLPGERWFPELVVVLEGAAKAMDAEAPGVRIVRASGEGDDTIVEVARELAPQRQVTVATSDRGLSERVTEVGGAVRGADWFRNLLD